jgi:DNA-directed RNA polymerase specialized sigma24 family protein
VGAILKRNGVVTRGGGLSPAQIDEAVELYEAGSSLARIGRKMGVSARTVQLRLRECGVRMRDTHGRDR